MPGIISRAKTAFSYLVDGANWRMREMRPNEPRTDRGINAEVSPDDWRWLLSDSRKLFANVGPVRGAINDKAMYSVGRAWLPKFLGNDKAWGQLATEWLINEWYPIADVRGYDFQTHLHLASVSIDRDGDIFPELTEYEGGFPAVQLVPAHLVGMSGEPQTVETGPYRGLRIFNGVIVNNAGRAVAYRIYESLTKWTDVSALNLAHLYEPEWADQVRGFPGLSHAILDLKDLRQVQDYEKLASAIASSIGILEYNETGMADAGDPMVALQKKTSYDSVATSSTRVIQEYDGGRVKYFRGNTGSKLEAFKSERPGQAWESFMNRLIRMGCAGFGWPYELTWDASALGGANIRLLVAKAMRAVEDRQDLLRPIAKREVGYAISKAIKIGRLPGSAEWYKWGFTMPPRMTVDYGRDKAQDREDYAAGITNLTDICAERGETIDEHIAERAAENQKLRDAGLPVPGESGVVADPPAPDEPPQRQ